PEVPDQRHRCVRLRRRHRLPGAAGGGARGGSGRPRNRANSPLIMAPPSLELPPPHSPFAALGSCRRRASFLAAALLAAAAVSSCASEPPPAPVAPQPAGPVGAVQPPAFTSPPVASPAAREDQRTRERREITEAAWRTVREKHYDPKLGGVDWDAMLKKYE